MPANAVDHLSIINIRDEWGTQLELVEKACNDYDIHPVLDVAASDINHVCHRYFAKDDVPFDALHRKWDEDFFMNAPYSQQYTFMKMAYNESKNNNVNGLILAYSKTDTNWFNEFVFDQKSQKWLAEFYPIHHRIKFLDETGRIPKTCGVCTSLSKVTNKKIERYYDIERCPIHNVKLRENVAPYPSCWIIYRRQ